MKKTAMTVRSALSAALMVILMLNLCCFTYCAETAPVNTSIPAQKTSGTKSSPAIPEGLTPEAASEYLKIVQDVCREYGPEQLIWMDGDFLPHRVGFCGGIFANLDGDGVPEMILLCRADDRNAEYESDAVEQIWTWRNGTPYQSLKNEIPSSTPNGREFYFLLQGKERDYLKCISEQNELGLDAYTSYPAITKEGEYERDGSKGFSDESKCTEIKLSAANNILLANSDYFLYTLITAAAEADGSDPQMVLAKMGYSIDPSTMRGATEEYDPAAVPVAEDGTVDWYGVLRAFYDNKPEEFADASALTAKVQSHQDAGWNLREGILAADLFDMSGDGKDKLILYRIDPVDDTIPYELVYIYLYSCRDGKINCSMIGPVNQSDLSPFTGVGYSSFRAGIAQLNGKPYVWTENILNSYFANGSDFAVKIYDFEHGEEEDYLPLRWLIGKTEGDTNGVSFGLQTFDNESPSFPESEELLWKDDYGNGNNGPCADPASAVKEGYKRIGFPDIAVYSSDPSTDTGNTGDQYRDQFPTYWNTSAVKKSLQIIESGPPSSDYSCREMTSRIDDFTGMENAIRSHDSAYAEYMEFLEKTAPANPPKETSPGGTENKNTE